MSDYSQITDFSTKDALATGDANKVIKGSEVDAELGAISTAIATKIDEVGTASQNNIATFNTVGGVKDSGTAISSVVTTTSALLMPTGGIAMWVTGTAPTGYLLCNGSNVSRSTYSALFAVIGTTYGVGDGSTTFGLPDFVGRVGIGAGTGDASDATAHALGDEGGNETHTLTTAQIPSHAHTNTIPKYYEGTGTNIWPGGNAAMGGSHSWSTNAAGGGGSHNNMQPYVTVNYIIKT